MVAPRRGYPGIYLGKLRIVRAGFVPADGSGVRRTVRREDEGLQYFTPGRNCELKDLFLDCFAVLVVAAVMFIWEGIKK